MSEPLRIAIAGLGTVGCGVLKLLQENAAILENRCGRRLEVQAVSARNRDAARPVDISDYQWFDDPVTMAAADDIDVVVELIGGADGVAKALTESAFTARHHVVTANKALVACHGVGLAQVAEQAGRAFRFEAAVAGGIPIVKALREGLAGNRISCIYGILNGTANFILTQMQQTQRPFAEVLAEAQSLGYAEADPSFDVDGIDTAHKLAILAGLAFDTVINFDAVHVEGIRQIAPLDIQYADDLGYRIKLLGIAEQTDSGLLQRVHPCLVGKNTPIAHVDDAYNAVVAEGNFVGRTVFEGRGAGAGPTASSVVADLMDIARNDWGTVFACPADQLRVPSLVPMADHEGPYYVRFFVVDRPGVMADIAAALRDADVSMESVIQRSRAPGEGVMLVMVTHETREKYMLSALACIEEIDAVIDKPIMIRIENL